MGGKRSLSAQSCTLPPATESPVASKLEIHTTLKASHAALMQFTRNMGVSAGISSITHEKAPACEAGQQRGKDSSPGWGWVGKEPFGHWDTHPGGVETVKIDRLIAAPTGLMGSPKIGVE